MVINKYQMRSTIYPSVNDITMVSPIKITDSGVYVKLLEYNNIEGLIILSDISKSRMRSINKHVRIGKKFPACVQTVDDKTNNITLSKKAVTISEINTCTTNFKIWRQLFDLISLFTRKLQEEHNVTLDINTAYKLFIWSLSDDPEFLLIALKSASKDIYLVYEDKLTGVDETLITCFQNTLTNKFKSRDVLLEAVMEICCIESDGICIIKQVLLSAASMATTEIPFRIKLIKSPYYSITVKTNDQIQSIELINRVINTIKLELAKNKASFKIIKMAEAIVDKEFEPEKSDDESNNNSDD